MSRPRPASLVGGIVLCCVLAFGAFALASILSVPPELLPVFIWGHALRRALLRLVDNLPALSAAGAMVAYSLFGSRASSVEGPAVPAVQAVVRPALVILLTVTLAYIVAGGLLAPFLWRRLLVMEQASVSAAEYRDAMREAARRAEESGAAADYRAAWEAAQRYLEIDPGNKEMIEGGARYERQYVDARIVEEERARQEAASGAAARADDQGRDPVEMLIQAEAFYEAGDYYSAHYYASLAQRGGEVKQRAAALVAAAERKISPQTLLSDKATAEERAAAEQARLKWEAYGLYERGDWAGAYYRFGELARQYPEDPDIKRYHEEARKKVLETAFAIEEARQALGASGVEGLLFVADRGEKGLEVVSIRKMVRSPGGVYFADIEALRILPGFGPTLHLFARYGKLQGAMIFLHAVDSQARWRSEEPRVYLATDSGEVTVALDPGLEPDVLEYVNPDPRALRAVPAGVLWGMRSWARRAGLLQEAVELELVLFFVRPAMSLALSLWALALAWRYRARYFGRPSIIALSSLAAFPIAVAGVWWLLTDAARLLYAGCLIALGFLPTAVAAAVVQSLLILVALVSLARNTVD